jgi:SRSO17 transposase
VTPTTFAPGFESRLECFLGHVGEELPRSDQRQKFALYTLGLLSEAERKSVEPLAAPTRPDAPDAAHQSMLHFVANAPWDDRAVRRRALAWALWGATARSPVRGIILDDTGLLKQGRHSVGVQRQYTGSAGKITNCQVAVTLCLFTDHDTIPLDVALYLPASWAEDAERRATARVPEGVAFQTKGELARAMLRAAHAEGIPLGDLLLADGDYGRDPETRALAGELGMKYAVGILGTQRVWDVEGVWTEPMSVAELVACMPRRGFRRLSWRDDTSGKPLSARFAFRRVLLAEGKREPGVEAEAVWLILEWRDGEPAPQRFFVSDLPKRTKRKELVRRLKDRWRTERLYEDMKGEVGFDHYEGRSWPGWQHHMSVVLCAYALLVAERSMAFPPGAPGDPAPRAKRRAPRAARGRLAPVAAPPVREDDHRALATEVPDMRSRPRGSRAARAGSARLDLTQ